MEVTVVAFLAIWWAVNENFSVSACWIVGFRIAGTQYRQFDGRCTQNTHPQRAWRTHSLFTSTHECECVHVAQVKMVYLYHLCAPERIHLQVSHVTTMLVVPAPSHFQTTIARSTVWTARPSPRQHCTPTTTSARTSSRTTSSWTPFQQTQSSWDTTQKNHSRILNMRVPETCASTRPLVVGPKCFRPKKLRQVRWCLRKRISVNYTMYREFGEQDQQASVMKKTTGFGQIQVHSSLDHEMTDTSPIEDTSYLQSQMHFWRVHWNRCGGLWSRRRKDSKKVADFTTACPKSFRETGCNGQPGKRGKCTNVSPVTGSELLGDRLRYFHQNVMNGETKRGVLCSETLMCRIWVKLFSKAIKITCWIEQERI